MKNLLKKVKWLARASHRRASAAAAIGTLIAMLAGFGMSFAQGESTVAPAQGLPAQLSAPAAAGLAERLAKDGAGPLVNISMGGAAAGAEGGKTDGNAASIIQLMLIFTLLTLAPSILAMVTPFTRIIIVLSLLRNALGTQQAPPNTVLVGLALFLSLFIMMPVLGRINDVAIKPYAAEQIGYEEALTLGQQPLREFMLPNTRDKDLALFINMAQLDMDLPVEAVPMHVLIPAFMISELKTAFIIGFFIYLPFLVIDMVVSSVLMSMGMMMLPPVLISLPFKLLMFILADGWNQIFSSLVQSFRGVHGGG